MVRFVKLGSQLSLLDDYHEFAWYNTVIDSFMAFGYGDQAWGSWSSFVDSYHAYNPYDEEMYSLERFKGLFQEDF